MKYCSKCILPENFPAIKFDDNGVCSYCHEYEPTIPKGKEAFLKALEPYRKSNGEPDCLVAFSGGRDSSYGLHYIKKELGMNPIAFTYDWGMVTDLARRNQARMVGKLGVEHVIVAADIEKKRRNIRKNVEAWLKKPDLGMVPLFMAGDKQCEYYAKKVARQNNIKLIIFCRGLRLEQDELKFAYAGNITDSNPDGVIHYMSFVNKIKLLYYYAKNYILNPSYINISIWDTFFAYYVTYMMKTDFEYFWHYIPWNEKTIVDTIVNEYGWEKEPQTAQSWRTDDGTSPFYNYIYNAVGGFTENDAFRANQVREGMITREEAFELVKIENQPRTDALKWYFESIGVDHDRALSIVDSIPKTYKHP